MTGSSIRPAKQRLTKVSDIDRALGPTENIYYLLDKLYCLNFVVYAEIDGRFDIERLAGALHAVQAEHPLLRARLALAGGRPWFKPVAADAHPIPIERGGLRDWRARIEAQLERPFVDEAPLARFMFFGTGARKSVAAMVFHHSIADGRSGADVFIEVLRRAGGEELPLSFRPARPSAQALDLVKLSGPVGATIRTFGYWLQQGRSALKQARQLPGFDMAVRRRAAHQRSCLSRSAKTKARALLEACRAHGVTMQGALGAAQLLAINDEFEVAAPRNLALNSLADLRGLLGGQPDPAGPGPVHRHGHHGALHPRRAGLLAPGRRCQEPAQGRARQRRCKPGSLHPSRGRALSTQRGRRPHGAGPRRPGPAVVDADERGPLRPGGAGRRRDASHAGLPGVAARPASDLRHGVEPGRRHAPESAVRPAQDRRLAGAAPGRRDGRSPRTGGERLKSAGAAKALSFAPTHLARRHVLLEVTDLRVTLHTSRGPADALRGVSFSMQRGDTVGLIGESGCGKRITALALMGLLPDGAHGRRLDPLRRPGADGAGRRRDVRAARRAHRHDLPGADDGAEPAAHHRPRRSPSRCACTRAWTPPRRAPRRCACSSACSCPTRAKRLDAYPHQLSGGQRQRVVIAIALACGPDLLIADEPTTALDVTIQREVLDLIAELVAEDGMGLLLISHDLGVMAETVQRMLVMYGGTVVESGPDRRPSSSAWRTPTRAACSRRGRGWAWRAARGWPPSPAACPSWPTCRPAAPSPSAARWVVDDCRRALPAPQAVGPTHQARCIRLDAV